MDNNALTTTTSAAAAGSNPTVAEAEAMLSMIEGNGPAPDAFRGIAKVLLDSVKRVKRAKKDVDAKDQEHRVVGLAKQTLCALLASLADVTAAETVVDTLEAIFDDGASSSSSSSSSSSGGQFCLHKAIRAAYDVGEDRNRIKGFLMADALLGAISAARETVKASGKTSAESKKALPALYKRLDALQRKLVLEWLRSALRHMVPYSTGRVTTGSIQMASATLLSNMLGKFHDPAVVGEILAEVFLAKGEDPAWPSFRQTLRGLPLICFQPVHKPLMFFVLRVVRAMLKDSSAFKDRLATLAGDVSRWTSFDELEALIKGESKHQQQRSGSSSEDAYQSFLLSVYEGLHAKAELIDRGTTSGSSSNAGAATTPMDVDGSKGKGSKDVTSFEAIVRADGSKACLGTIHAFKASSYRKVSDTRDPTTTKAADEGAVLPGCKSVVDWTVDCDGLGNGLFVSIGGLSLEGSESSAPVLIQTQQQLSSSATDTTAIAAPSADAAADDDDPIVVLPWPLIERVVFVPSRRCIKVHTFEVNHLTSAKYTASNASRMANAAAAAAAGASSMVPPASASPDLLEGLGPTYIVRMRDQGSYLNAKGMIAALRGSNVALLEATEASLNINGSSSAGTPNAMDATAIVRTAAGKKGAAAKLATPTPDLAQRVSDIDIDPSVESDPAALALVFNQLMASLSMGSPAADDAAGDAAAAASGGKGSKSTGGKKGKGGKQSLSQPTASTQAALAPAMVVLPLDDEAPGNAPLALAEQLRTKLRNRHLNPQQGAGAGSANPASAGAASTSGGAASTTGGRSKGASSSSSSSADNRKAGSKKHLAIPGADGHDPGAADGNADSEGVDAEVLEAATLAHVQAAMLQLSNTANDYSAQRRRALKEGGRGPKVSECENDIRLHRLNRNNDKDAAAASDPLFAGAQEDPEDAPEPAPAPAPQASAAASKGSKAGTNNVKQQANSKKAAVPASSAAPVHEDPASSSAAAGSARPKRRAAEAAKAKGFKEESEGLDRDDNDDNDDEDGEGSDAEQDDEEIKRVMRLSKKTASAAVANASSSDGTGHSNTNTSMLATSKWAAKAKVTVAETGGGFDFQDDSDAGQQSATKSNNAASAKPDNSKSSKALAAPAAAALAGGKRKAPQPQPQATAAEEEPEPAAAAAKTKKARTGASPIRPKDNKPASATMAAGAPVTPDAQADNNGGDSSVDSRDQDNHGKKTKISAKHKPIVPSYAQEEDDDIADDEDEGDREDHEYGYGSGARDRFHSHSSAIDTSAASLAFGGADPAAALGFRLVAGEPSSASDADLKAQAISALGLSPDLAGASSSSSSSSSAGPDTDVARFYLSLLEKVTNTIRRAQYDEDAPVSKLAAGVVDGGKVTLEKLAVTARADYVSLLDKEHAAMDKDAGEVEDRYRASAAALVASHVDAITAAALSVDKALRSYVARRDKRASRDDGKIAQALKLLEDRKRRAEEVTRRYQREVASLEAEAVKRIEADLEAIQAGKYRASAAAAGKAGGASSKGSPIASSGGAGAAGSSGGRGSRPAGAGRKKSDGGGSRRLSIFDPEDEDSQAITSTFAAAYGGGSGVKSSSAAGKKSKGSSTGSAGYALSQQLDDLRELYG